MTAPGQRQYPILSKQCDRLNFSGTHRMGRWRQARKDGEYFDKAEQADRNEPKQHDWTKGTANSRGPQWLDKKQCTP